MRSPNCITGELGEPDACQRTSIRRVIYLISVVTSYFFTMSALAQGVAPTTLSENFRLIKAAEVVGTLGSELFGDKINFYNGSLEFVQTDVNLAGNSKLSVTISRKLTTGRINVQGGLFSERDVEIPHMHGTFSRQFGWQKLDANGVPSSARWSNFGAPPSVSNGQSTYRALEYWYGNSIYVPGQGNQAVLRRTVWNVPVPGTIRMVSAPLGEPI